MPDTDPFGPENFAAKTGVSRETMELIKRFDVVFLEWTRRLNLVAKSTIAERWQRHYLDSAQLSPIVPANAKSVMDFGSGAGFPGLFLALLSLSDPNAKERHYYLVESVTKKCAFLRHVVADLGLTNVTVLNRRIEEIEEIKKVDVVTARALANLDTLLRYARPFLHQGSVCLFLKGENLQDELTAAATRWKMQVIPHPSLSHEAATILEIRNLSRV